MCSLNSPLHLGWLTIGTMSGGHGWRSVSSHTVSEWSSSSLVKTSWPHKVCLNVCHSSWTESCLRIGGARNYSSLLSHVPACLAHSRSLEVLVGVNSKCLVVGWCKGGNAQVGVLTPSLLVLCAGEAPWSWKSWKQQQMGNKAEEQWRIERWWEESIKGEYADHWNHKNQAYCDQKN